MTGVQELAAGGNHSLILKLDGTVWACGRNYFGQLGNVMSFGTENPNPTPLQIIFQGR
jgi:alpha-tubulin suppressor-like RCC1 family protein